MPATHIFGILHDEQAANSLIQSFKSTFHSHEIVLMDNAAAGTQALLQHAESLQSVSGRQSDPAEWQSIETVMGLTFSDANSVQTGIQPAQAGIGPVPLTLTSWFMDEHPGGVSYSVHHLLSAVDRGELLVKADVYAHQEDEAIQLFQNHGCSLVARTRSEQ